MIIFSLVVGRFAGVGHPRSFPTRDQGRGWLPANSVPFGQVTRFSVTNAAEQDPCNHAPFVPCNQAPFVKTPP
jgi:hypothetical protein